MMKKGRRDKILTTAFGDGDSLDLNGLTDEERAEYEDARKLSEGLKTLREVPECQLSTERLISAVLSSAAKKRQTFGWGHAVAVAAFGAMAFFALQSSLFTPGENADGNVAFGAEPIRDDISTVGVAVPDESLGEILTDPETAAPETLIADDIDPPPPMVDAEAVEDSDTPAADGSAVLAASTDAISGDVEPAVLDAGETVKLTTVALERTGPDPREPLVIVDFALEADNGTYIAIELETLRDVVFGG